MWVCKSIYLDSRGSIWCSVAPPRCPEIVNQVGLCLVCQFLFSLGEGKNCLTCYVCRNFFQWSSNNFKLSEIVTLWLATTWRPWRVPNFPPFLESHDGLVCLFGGLDQKLAHPHSLPSFYLKLRFTRKEKKMAHCAYCGSASFKLYAMRTHPASVTTGYWIHSQPPGAPLFLIIPVWLVDLTSTLRPGNREEKFLRGEIASPMPFWFLPGSLPSLL